MARVEDTLRDLDEEGGARADAHDDEPLVAGGDDHREEVANRRNRSQIAPSMSERIAAVDSRDCGGPSTMPKAVRAAAARITPVGIASDRVRLRNPGT